MGEPAYGGLECANRLKTTEPGDVSSRRQREVSDGE